MKISEIKDKKIWESFISRNSPQSFFQSWDWGEITKSNPDRKIRFLGRYGIYEAGELLGIFQLQKIIARRGSFLQIRHGPVLTGFSGSIFNFLVGYLKDLCRTESASFIRVSPLLFPLEKNITLFKDAGFINSPIHRMDGEYCWVLDLDLSEEELLQNMRKTTRYLIRWALKNGVEIKKTAKTGNMQKFLELYDLTAKRHQFIKHGGIREEFEILAKDNKAMLFEGFHNRKLLSGALIIFYQNQAIYHHSASIEQKIPVNYLLQWEVIKEAKARGFKIYNFWGISDPGNNRHPWKNLTLFKMGFGGRVVEYLHSQDLPVNKLLYSKTYLIETVRKFQKGY